MQDALLETTFVNSVDAPSLALLLPIIQRGLRSKTELKKKASKIVGNLCALVSSPADLAPYVALVLPELKRALVDPIPEVRSIAARSLASLVAGMGSAHFPELVPHLVATLQSDAGAVERHGAAQGLAEVLAVLGPDALPKALPDIADGCRSARPQAREGYLTLLRHLPHTLGPRFEPHLPFVLPLVLASLADDNEGARDAALAAGRVLVERYARTALPLLLPAVEAGVVAPGWRLRCSSVELLGALLFRVAGVSGRVQTDTSAADSDSVGTEAAARALGASLGDAARLGVLSALYLARFDVALPVRGAALHVWKTLVPNTPRCLAEALPTLLRRLLQALGGSQPDGRAAAVRCLGELVRKLPDRVLVQAVPVLLAGLSRDQPSAATRLGACAGLGELLQAAPRPLLAPLYGTLVPGVQAALCDDDPAVRAAAGDAFAQLFRGGGGVDAGAEVVPALLASLDGDDPAALEGLRQVLKAQPRLTAAVLPRLAEAPLSAFAAHALAAVAQGAGHLLPLHLHTVLPPLLDGAAGGPGPTADACHAAAVAVCGCVEADSVQYLLPELTGALADPRPSLRAAAARLAAAVAAERLDDGHTVAQLLAALVEGLADEDGDACAAAAAALAALAANLPKESLGSHARTVREAVAAARERVRRRRPDAVPLLPGLCAPKALAPLAPVYLAALLAGHSDARAYAADGLAELVEAASEEGLRSQVVAITGPLIRVVSDKVPSPLRCAVLACLVAVCGRAGAALKPFLPQLQTTFARALQDPLRAVRTAGAAGLAVLFRQQTRVDPLLSELAHLVGGGDGGATAAAVSPQDPGVRDSTLSALAGVLQAAGQHASPGVVGAVVDALTALLSAPGLGSDTAAAAALALGAAARWLEAAPCCVLWARLCDPGGGPAEARPGLGAALGAVLDAAPAAALAQPPARLRACLAAMLGDERPAVRALAVRAAATALQHASHATAAPFGDLLATALQDEAGDVRRRALRALTRLSAAPLVPTLLPALLPHAVAALSDASLPVKLAAERAVRRCLGLTSECAVAAAAAAATAAGVRARLADSLLRRLARLDDDVDDDAEDEALVW